MRELTISAPYRDPYSRRRTADWLVVVRAGDLVDVHHFTDQDDADAFAARAQELADHPELDTDDRELDARREA
jgi:hypothetical protein